MLSGLKIQDQISTLAIHSDVTYTDLKLVKPGAYYWTDDKIKETSQNQLMLMPRVSDPQTWNHIWHRKWHRLVPGQT